METKKNILQTITYGILLSIGIITISLVSKYTGISFLIVGNHTPETGAVETTGLQNSGYICEGVENCITDISGNKLEIPEDPRTYIDYIKKTGKVGIDYFIIQPTPQPIIRSKDKNQNNNIMYSYFATNRPTLELKKPVSGYIMFITKTPISDNRDLFLGINGKSLSQILRNNKLALPVFNENEYLYTFEEIPLGLGTRDLNTYISSGKLVINGFVGETGNGIKEIWIILKK